MEKTIVIIVLVSLKKYMGLWYNTASPEMRSLVGASTSHERAGRNHEIDGKLGRARVLVHGRILLAPRLAPRQCRNTLLESAFGSVVTFVATEVAEDRKKSDFFDRVAWVVGTPQFVTAGFRVACPLADATFCLFDCQYQLLATLVLCVSQLLAL